MKDKHNKKIKQSIRNINTNFIDEKNIEKNLRDKINQEIANEFYRPNPKN